MFRLDTPLHRRPLWQHALGAVALAAAVCAACAWAVSTYQQRERHATTQLGESQKLLNDLQTRSKAQPTGDFTAQLLAATGAEDVERDITRFARGNSVQVVTLAVHPQPATARELAATRLSVTAVADYAPMKAWLKELLDRYPSLGVTSLSMRASAGNASRLEANLVLTLFTKD